MNRSVYRRLLALLLAWVSLVSTAAAQDDLMTACGSCTCNMRQASADCSGRQLHNLPADLPANITHLNLARNRIRSSGEDPVRLCQKYPDLKEVSLAWNGMRTLSTLLHGCDHLEQLDLTGNILEAVPPTVFTDVNNIQALTSLELQELDAAMFHSLKRLETLQLTFHGLTLQPGVFRELSSLRSLTLALEKALRLPKRLFSVTEGNVLQQLTLKGSKVKDIPDDLFRELVSLKELHLDLPHVLQLSMNTRDEHKYLQLLEVSFVRSLAEDMLSGLHALQVVIFRGVSHLAGQHLFQTATAVKELEIVECSLTQLPLGWLDNMLALETLNLSENRLEELTPSDFIHLTALKHLVLSNNKIQDLPAGVFSGIKSTLRQLLLNDNQLRQLSTDTVADMRMLEVLDLRRNMINNISAHSLRNLPRLQILKLSGNYISALDHVLFDSLPMLEELDLSENMLWQFPSTLLALNLSQLLLAANNLQRVPGQQLCHMSGLRALALEDNPVWCDCSLRMLHQCLPRLLLSGMCSAPAGMEGQSMAEMPVCAAATSVSAAPTWLAETSSLAPPSSPVVFWLEPTLARLPDLDTWSPLLAAVTFTGHSRTPLASSVAASPTAVISPSATASLAAVISPSATASLTAVISPSATASLTAVISPSATASLTAVISPSATASLTAVISPSATASLAAVISPSATASLTAVISPSVTATLTAVISPSATASLTAVISPSATASLTAVISPSATASLTAVISPSATASLTAVISPSATASLTAVISPSATASLTAVISPSATASLTAVISPSATASLTAVISPSATASLTAVISPSVTASLTAVISPSAAASLTVVISPSATASWGTPTQLSASSRWLSSRVSVTLLLSSSWTPELTPAVSASLPAHLFTDNSGHSQPYLLATPDTISPALSTSYPTLRVSASTAGIEITSTQAVAGRHSQLSAPTASLTHSPDPVADLDLDYDAYIEQEIVRPLVAAGLLERQDQLPAIPDTDPLEATQLAQSSVVSTYVDVPNSPAVDTQPDSFSIIDMPRAAITHAPPRPDNHSEPLPPRVAQVHAEPDTEETSAVVSVAGEIAVAMFFSLAIVLSILSGILLYRKYFHAGSYTAASSCTDQQPHHMVHMQPLDADPASLSASTTAIASHHQPAHRQVPV